VPLAPDVFRIGAPTRVKIVRILTTPIAHDIREFQRCFAGIALAAILQAVGQTNWGTLLTARLFTTGGKSQREDN